MRVSFILIVTIKPNNMRGGRVAVLSHVCLRALLLKKTHPDSTLNAFLNSNFHYNSKSFSSI